MMDADKRYAVVNHDITDAVAFDTFTEAIVFFRLMNYYRIRDRVLNLWVVEDKRHKEYEMKELYPMERMKQSLAIEIARLERFKYDLETDVYSLRMELHDIDSEINKHTNLESHAEMLAKTGLLDINNSRLNFDIKNELANAIRLILDL